MLASTFAIGTPRPRPNDTHGQVSWLPDRRLRPAFPPVMDSGMMERASPVTVAGAAEVSHLLPFSGLREQANP